VIERLFYNGIVSFFNKKVLLNRRGGKCKEDEERKI